MSLAASLVRSLICFSHLIYDRRPRRHLALPSGLERIFGEECVRKDPNLELLENKRSSCLVLFFVLCRTHTGET